MFGKSTRFRWSEACLVGLLALLATAARCGHDSAGGANDESSKAAEQKPAAEAESAEQEASEEQEPADSKVQRSTKKRLEPKEADRKAVQKLVGDFTQFGFDLYGELSGKEVEGNLVYSPYNLSSVLAMAYAGAGGQTAAEMKKALRFELREPTLHRAANALDRRIAARPAESESDGEGEPKGDRLETANGLWAQKGLALQPAFLDTLAADVEGH